MKKASDNNITDEFANFNDKKPAWYLKTSVIVTMLLSSFIIGIIGLLVSPSPITLETINIAIPNHQFEYDINTEIPIEVSVLPKDADTKSLNFISNGETLTFSESAINTGSEEGTYNISIESGDVKSNTITVSVVDMAAREAEEQRIAEEKQLAEEKAAQEAEERRLAEEKAAQEAEERRLAEEQAAKEAEEQRLAEEKAAQEEQRHREASASSDSTSQNSASSSGDSGNVENFNTYDNAEQQQTTASFVLNTSSHKIHYPSCRDVPKIAPQNYSTSNQTLDELKAQGYTTCGHCF